MRFIGTALVASAMALVACGGGEKQAASGGGETTQAAPTPAAAPAAAPAGSSSTAGAAGAAAPITGKTWEVKMVGDDKGYRYDPATLTIKQGDGVKFIMISGGPHNVTFDTTAIPAGAEAQLTANMPNQMAKLESNFMMNPNETLTVSFANVPKGEYHIFCTPHLALGMKGVITVQ